MCTSSLNLVVCHHDLYQSTQSQNNDQFRGRSYGGAGLLLNPTIITRALQYHVQIQTLPAHMMMVFSAVQF